MREFLSIIILINLLLLPNIVDIGAPSTTQIIDIEIMEFQSSLSYKINDEYFSLIPYHDNDDSNHFIYSSSSCSYMFNEDAISLNTQYLGDTNSTIIIRHKDSNSVNPLGESYYSHYSNYFSGTDKTYWMKSIRNYQEISYPNLYNNIDLTFYFQNQQLKSDYLVRPGGNPDDIVMEINGVRSVSIDNDGNLEANVQGQSILLIEKPYCYQIIDEVEVEITSHFSVNNNLVTIEIYDFDPNVDLIIDPIMYSSFLGGTDDDRSYEIFTDNSYNVYIAGTTSSIDFPFTHTGYYTTNQRSKQGIFVSKFDSSGETIFSTFIGGNDTEKVNALVVDNDENVYLSGYTFSSNFPTTSDSYCETFNDEDYNSDAFIVKLSKDGTSLLFSTYLGGTEKDRCYGMVLDSSNNVVITGYTHSNDFPTTESSIDEEYNGMGDIFISKLSSNGTLLLSSTFLGERSFEWALDITIDGEDNVYVTGATGSKYFPVTSGAYQGKQVSLRDVFISKLNHNFTTLIFSMVIGGEFHDDGEKLLLDDMRNVYIIGDTISEDFPTTNNSYNPHFNGEGGLGGSEDIFICKFDQNGEKLLFSTFIGGSKKDIARDFVLGKSGNIIITGASSSNDFPTTYGCHQNQIRSARFDIILFEMNTTGDELIYSTYIGGNDYDISFSMANYKNDSVIITGITESNDFPTSEDADDRSFNGEEDAYTMEFSLVPTNNRDSSENPLETFQFGLLFIFVLIALVIALNKIFRKK